MLLMKLISIINFNNLIIFYCILSNLILMSNIKVSKAIKTQSQQMDTRTGKEMISGKSLLRKRRYLEFPEGSSFQLVYDMNLAVVDFTNYLVVGVTVALAWELPSKPPSELLQNLKQHFINKPFSHQNYKDTTNMEYMSYPAVAPYDFNHLAAVMDDFPTVFHPPMHQSYQLEKKSGKFFNENLLKNQRISSVLPMKNLNTDKTMTAGNLFYSKYPWWNLPTRLTDVLTKQRPQIFATKHVLSSSPGKRDDLLPHRILPVFGKRYNTILKRHKRSGIETDELSTWDQLNIHHHRNTRHELYKRIEKYLNQRGWNGYECVLRALCETGQKLHERLPGSFIGEIMRVIFTLSEPLETLSEVTSKLQSYDEAQAFEGDCARRYQLCKHSLWSSQFIH